MFCFVRLLACSSIHFHCLSVAVLVRAGHSIWRSQGERWNTSFTIFAIMVVFWFFPGLWRLPGIVSLKLFHFGREKENGLCWSCFVPGGTAAVLSRADTGGKEAITVALALTKTLHLQREEEITPQWCLTLLPRSGSWALGPMNCYTTATNGCYTNAQTPHYKSAAVTHNGNAPAITQQQQERGRFVQEVSSPAQGWLEWFLFCCIITQN